MNAALIGSVSSSAAVLRGMLRGGLQVAGVCGLHERHAARVSDFCDLRPLAEAAGVPFVAFDKVTEAAVAEFLNRQRPDWLFVVGISQLVPAAVRSLARAGAVGFHPTPLPMRRQPPLPARLAFEWAWHQPGAALVRSHDSFCGALASAAPIRSRLGATAPTTRSATARYAFALVPAKNLIRPRSSPSWVGS